MNDDNSRISAELSKSSVFARPRERLRRRNKPPCALSIANRDAVRIAKCTSVTLSTTTARALDEHAFYAPVSG